MISPSRSISRIARDIEDGAHDGDVGGMGGVGTCDVSLR